MPLVAYIDDDAVPAPDWLERIARTFEQDARIAAVGGCDVICSDDQPRPRARGRRRPPQVGRIQWTGRMTANHHLGAGPARDVDVLKGVNMSFRRAAVSVHGFDERLRGPGAVVHAELSICLPLRSQGLRIIYDPAIMVTHYPAPRPAGDHRSSLTGESAFNAAHNEGLEILEYLKPQRRRVFAVWSLLIGNTEAPGAAVLVRDLARHKPGALIRFAAAQRGRAAAWRTRRLPRMRPEPAVSHESDTQAPPVAR
jgi:GT2 family glycosyltransferase